MKKTLNFVIKESITEALIRLMHKKNFSDISIIEITKLAGVSRVSFYRNFDSKEDVLIKHMYEHSANTFTALKTKSAHERLIGLFQIADGLTDILDLLYAQNLSHLFLQYFAVTVGPKPEQPNTEAFENAIIMSLCFGTLDEWIKRDRQESPEEMVSILQRTITGCLE